MGDRLKEMMETDDDQARPIGDHTKKVIASINAMTEPGFNPRAFLHPPGDDALRAQAVALLGKAYDRSWVGDPSDNRPPLLVADQATGGEPAKALLRVAALYHDIGKLISTDQHVSRGVHLMRDVSVADRRDIEALFEDFTTRRGFWSILRHHDVYGCLCTGEASLPAISAMVGWTYHRDFPHQIDRSVPAYLTYLLWLNLADVNAQLQQTFGGITAVEAHRYLSDWNRIITYLDPEGQGIAVADRAGFTDWSFQVAAQPEMTIQRIARLVATCYHVEALHAPPQRHIEALVEEELLALHGPRLEEFCKRFSHFTKLEYGLRFFYLVMRDILLDHAILMRREGTALADYPFHDSHKGIGNIERLEDKDVSEKARLDALRTMVNRVCNILNRIVEEYRQLVDRGPSPNLRIGVDMSGLMRPSETGWAICQSLKGSGSRALWWIADEINVWLYTE
jgi:hypothetical protein